MATIAQHPARPMTIPRPRGLLRWLTTVDHKEIGILYILVSIVCLFIGGFEALLIRVQLFTPLNSFLGPDAYNAVFTMHGTTMIFLVIMPWLLGFANYMVPLMIGARDMAFPRLNAFSIWLLIFGALLLNYSFLQGVPPNVGWFAYAPLTEPPYTLRENTDYWVLGTAVTSIGTIMTGLNLVVTPIKMRPPGMTAWRMPVFVWMMLIVGLLILWAFPTLTAAQVMIMFDRHLGTHFFDPKGGGDPLLWQHLFWWFGHPEVYIMALPAFGIMSEVVPVFSRKPIFGYGFVVGSGIAIAFYSFLVWAHHMFAVGMGTLPNAFFGASSMIIAVPTGIKIFSWLATMTGGRIRFTTAMLFATGLICTFTIGGLTGVHFAIVPVDWQTTDTYYVVGHFHYVLMGGSLFGIYAGLYYWFPKMFGRVLDERLGKIHFWLTFIGANMTFLPMHWLGLMGMPRRVYTYPDLPGWALWNQVETVGAFLQAIGALVLLYNVWRSWRRGQVAGDNPWDAWTLEWATTSPPPDYNFKTLPPIHSARPLWDLAHGYSAAAEARSPSQVPGGRAHDPDVPGQGAMGFFAQRSIPVLGTLLFVSSEAIFFVSLIVAFIQARLQVFQGFQAGNLDVLWTAVFSVALFASSGTIILAERQLHHDRQGAFRFWWIATILLGATFIVGQGIEYARLFREGIGISNNLFASAFFTLTGFHGLHVIIGLVMLTVVALLALRGDYRQGRRGAAVAAVATYWHFVDVVWVVVFSVVYIWAFISQRGG